MLGNFWLDSATFFVNILFLILIRNWNTEAFLFFPVPDMLPCAHSHRWLYFHGHKTSDSSRGDSVIADVRNLKLFSCSICYNSFDVWFTPFNCWQEYYTTLFMEVQKKKNHNFCLLLAVLFFPLTFGSCEGAEKGVLSPCSSTLSIWKRVLSRGVESFMPTAGLFD